MYACSERSVEFAEPRALDELNELHDPGGDAPASDETASVPGEPDSSKNLAMYGNRCAILSSAEDGSEQWDEAYGMVCWFRYKPKPGAGEDDPNYGYRAAFAHGSVRGGDEWHKLRLARLRHRVTNQSSGQEIVWWKPNSTTTTDGETDIPLNLGFSVGPFTASVSATLQNVPKQQVTPEEFNNKAFSWAWYSGIPSLHCCTVVPVGGGNWWKFRPANGASTAVRATICWTRPVDGAGPLRHGATVMSSLVDPQLAYLKGRMMPRSAWVRGLIIGVVLGLAVGGTLGVLLTTPSAEEYVLTGTIIKLSPDNSSLALSPDTGGRDLSFATLYESVGKDQVREGDHVRLRVIQRPGFAEVVLEVKNTAG